MNVVSHRGHWTHAQEQNSLSAFRRALSQRWAIETDVRHALGRLVVAHDLPAGDVIPLESLSEVHHDLAPDTVLALNIKCDGLQSLLADNQSYL
jgi:glycerophosphoryl diester phosphodiesterase